MVAPSLSVVTERMLAVYAPAFMAVNCCTSEVDEPLEVKVESDGEKPLLEILKEITSDAIILPMVTVMPFSVLSYTKLLADDQPTVRLRFVIV